MKLLNKISSVAIFFLYFGMVYATEPLPKGTTVSIDPTKPIEVDEKLGDIIPLDLVFQNESGKSVTLKDAIGNKPTILSLVYYECPGICSPLLNGVVEVINRMDFPSDKYQLLTISFNSKDTVELAARKRDNYLVEMKKEFNPESWHFYVGSEEAIQKLTAAIGYRFQQVGNDFLHPTTLVAISPHGKIARYLYGITYLPFDIKMALVEASEEKVGPTIAKVMRLCFKYDPKGRKYVLNVTRVFGILIFIFIFAFVFYLIRMNRRPRP